MKRVVMSRLGPSPRLARTLALRAWLLACAAAMLAWAGAAAAASPQVETAIKAIQAVGTDAGKLKLFCDLNKLLQEAGDKEDAATQKRIEDLITKIGADFGAAWDVGDELDENSPDGQAFYAAVDTLAEKCQQ